MAPSRLGHRRIASISAAMKARQAALRRLPAFAGASSVPTNYQPDPALKTASRGELESRIRKSCAVVQARLQNVSQLSVSSPCGCYASRALRSFDASEVQAYRDTGVFNEDRGCANRATVLIGADGTVVDTFATDSLGTPREADRYTEALAKL